MASVSEFEVTALQLGRDKSGLGDGNVRIVGGAVNGNPLLVVANALPLPWRVVITTRRFEAVTEIGVTHTNQDRSKQSMRLRVSHRRHRARRMADQDRMLV